VPATIVVSSTEVKGGGTMAVFSAAFPILAGKTDQARRFASDVVGARRREFDESQARFGSTRETWALQSTPDGDLMLVWFEAPDIEKGFATLAESTEPFDVWFRQQVQEITGFDLGAPPDDALPEVLVDWTA
jgi:hypothetical protein